MSSVFEKVMTEKDVTLKDICDVQPFIDALIQNQFQQYSALSIERHFPFTASFKELYIKKVNEQFDKEKESIIETIVTSVKTEDQLFETEVVLGQDMGYIRYLFPISYAQALITQGEFKPQEVNVSSLYEFTRHIQVDDVYEHVNDEPVILLSYPQSSPDFFCAGRKSSGSSGT